MDTASRDKWQVRYGAADYAPAKKPVSFLRQMVPRLRRGTALCLAAGTGRNAVYLAEQGFEVTAVDIAPKGLEWCRWLADERGVQIKTVEADLQSFDLGQEKWDLVTMVFYLQPELFPAIKAAVRPGGFFLFQTFSVDQLAKGRGPRNPAHLVRPGQMLAAFGDWRVRYYEDGEVEGEAVVRLLVEKPGGDQL